MLPSDDAFTDLQPTYRQYNEEANTKGRPHSTQYQRPRTLELQQQHSAPPGGMPGSRNLHGQSPGHVALLRGVHRLPCSGDL